MIILRCTCGYVVPSFLKPFLIFEGCKLRCLTIASFIYMVFLEDFGVVINHPPPALNYLCNCGSVAQGCGPKAIAVKWKRG